MNTPQKKIFVSWPGYSTSDPETGKRLADAGYDVVLRPKFGARSAQELEAMLDGAVAAIVSTDPFSRAVIEAQQNLKVIARVGVGTDSIDLAAASQRKILVTNTPGLNADTVAEHTFALMLALIRKVVDQDTLVKSGRWERVGDFTPGELAGRTVGLLGAGTIGRKVIDRLSGFGVKILFFDPIVRQADPATRIDSLPEILRISDILSLHLPLTAGTRLIIGAKEMEEMKSTALLINTSRGTLIDQAALFSALRKGSLAGAALDVFEEEPPPTATVRDVPNLICSPHLAGLSRESIRRMTVSATDSVLAVLSGQIPPSAINAQAVRNL
ncbi:MAG TPA: phosphoglycerate dehydrogenase [Chthoniobacterales bacterium]